MRPGVHRNVRFLAVLLTALAIVCAWPPSDGKSLVMRFVNWVVDPRNELPVLPPQLGFGVGDDPAAVDAHDATVRHYDSLYLQGGWTRRRLELKVADHPFDKSATRQVLIAISVATALIVWRWRLLS
jgi:hypothetical protein